MSALSPAVRLMSIVALFAAGCGLAGLVPVVSSASASYVVSGVVARAWAGDYGYLAAPWFLKPLASVLAQVAGGAGLAWAGTSLLGMAVGSGMAHGGVMAVAAAAGRSAWGVARLGMLVLKVALVMVLVVVGLRSASLLAQAVALFAQP